MGKKVISFGLNFGDILAVVGYSVLVASLWMLFGGLYGLLFIGLSFMAGGARISRAIDEKKRSVAAYEELYGSEEEE